MLPAAARAMVAALLQHADAFRWQRGVTPLSDERLMLAVPAAYVAVVLLLRAVLRGRAVPLGPLPALHNLVLMLWSLAMFAGTAAEAWRVSAAGAGAEWLFCLPPGTAVAGRLYWWSYVYYVSKARQACGAQPRAGEAVLQASDARLCCAPLCAQYYELLDTLLRVLKAQPLTFLHVFHHAVVLVMAYGVRSPTLHPALMPASHARAGAVAGVCAVAAGDRAADQHGHPRDDVQLLSAVFAGPAAGAGLQALRHQRPDRAVRLQARCVGRQS
jgi:hypothetical protein